MSDNELPVRPLPLRRQDATYYVCKNRGSFKDCLQTTGNSCRLCNECHRRGESDLVKNKIVCAYMSCAVIYWRESEKKND